MTMYRIDPLSDPRWENFVESHPAGSIFHSRSWLNALQESYGFKSCAVTTSLPEEDLSDGIPFCEIRSWLTGCRLTSLPFSDHCEPLSSDPANLLRMVRFLVSEAQDGGWDYLEMRPISSPAGWVAGSSEWGVSSEFCLHKLDLTPDLDTIFHSFHGSCIRRKIKKAEREKLYYEVGNSEKLLKRFYSLLVHTRRRHRIPPQPLKWFRSLLWNLGPRIQIRLASRKDQPVAAILTLLHQDTVTYKYGASHAELNFLGGMPYLFWRTICESRDAGYRFLDLGRTDQQNEGLATFKDRLGAERLRIRYIRYPIPKSRQRHGHLSMRLLKHVLPCFPLAATKQLGRLYRHAG